MTVRRLTTDEARRSGEAAIAGRSGRQRLWDLALHEDARFTRSTKAAVDDAIASPAAWLGLGMGR